MQTQERPLLISGDCVNFIGAPVVHDEPRFSSAGILPRLVGGPREASCHGVTDEDNSKMQVCWNRAMCDEMNIPEGYQNVAVLIIKWAEELDQLKSGNEVKELDELFRRSFNYPTQVVELHNRSKPQLQLDLAVMHFVDKYNGPHNLLIIYYTGHGSFHETRELLELHASDNQADPCEGNHRACAIWNYAERSLIEHAECDMVAIFDTCFASNLYKSIQQDDPRTYELLTASGHDRITVGPGPRSFTTALISALKDLLGLCGDRPFTIRQLCDKINLHPARRQNQSHVWSRFKRYDRNVALAPLKRTLAERKEDFNLGQTRAFLFLRLPLTVERLTEQQIYTTARAFSKAVKKAKLPVKRIDWLRLRNSRRKTEFADLGRVVGSAIKWKNSVLSSREAQPSIVTRDRIVKAIIDPHTQTVDDSFGLETVLFESESEPTPPPQMFRKRKHSGGHHSASNSPSKRRSSEDSEHSQRPGPYRNPLTPLSGTEPDVN